MAQQQIIDRDNLICCQFIAAFGQLQEFYQRKLVDNGYVPQVECLSLCEAGPETSGFMDKPLESTSRSAKERRIPMPSMADSPIQSTELDRLNAITGRFQRIINIVDSMKTQMKAKEEELSDCQISLKSKKKQIQKLKEKINSLESKHKSNYKVVALKEELKSKREQIKNLELIVKSKDNLLSEVKATSDNRLKEYQRTALKVFADAANKKFDSLFGEISHSLNKDQTLSIGQKNKDIVLKEIKRLFDKAKSSTDKHRGHNSDRKSEAKKEEKNHPKNKN